MNQSNWEEDLRKENMRVALIRIIKGIGSLQAQLGSQGHTLSRLEAKEANYIAPTHMVQSTEPPKLQVPIGWLIMGMFLASLTGGLLSWTLIRVAPPRELGYINGHVNNLEIRMQRLEQKLETQIVDSGKIYTP
ncbi:MAG: hypothetical protein F6K36_09105 [Symploca sp. SIO3C6]|nr:hypothetical protein [Symploca sp. SIO3C6]NET05058.1 hypothetical protein [Symploca sp. SIO2B6]NET51600.1 hypothetical protein [Merismopedia sp. SIO2A8]